MTFAITRMRLPALTLILTLLAAGWVLAAVAEEIPSTVELEELIASLEDEQARGELIHKLRIVAATREPERVSDVQGVIRQVGEELQSDPEVGSVVLEPLKIFGVDPFGDSAVVIEGRIKTQPIKQWMVGRAFNRLIKKRFDELGIEIPFLHRTIYLGQDKNGTAPPLRVSPGIAVHGTPTDILWPKRESEGPKSA